MFKKKYIFYLYWLLLSYSIVALFWWFLILLSQNNELVMLKKNAIVQQEKNISQEILDKNFNYLDIQYQKKLNQFYGEGLTFLIILLIGAFSFYKLIKREFRLYQQEQHFILGMTHELKTPISVVLLNLETLQKRQHDAEITKNLLMNSIHEIKRLNFFYDNILTSARLEEKNKHTYFEKINLSELTQKISHFYKNNYPNIQWNFNVSNTIFLFADKSLLEICFYNLLNNAIKYSHHPSIISFLGFKEQNSTIIEIVDNGIGISEEDKKNIFSKFYRSPTATVRNKNGMGLGLFVVKKIVNLHAGNIKIINNHPQGTIFKLIFYDIQKENFIN